MNVYSVSGLGFGGEGVGAANKNVKYSSSKKAKELGETDTPA